MAPFDFAPLTRRYAQDERLSGGAAAFALSLRRTYHRFCEAKSTPFALSVAERQRSEVEGRHPKGAVLSLYR